MFLLSSEEMIVSNIIINVMIMIPIVCYYRDIDKVGLTVICFERGILSTNLDCLMVIVDIEGDNFLVVEAKLERENFSFSA